MRIQGPKHHEISRSDAKQRDAKTEQSKSATADEIGKADVVQIGKTAKRLSVRSGTALNADVQARLDTVREQLKNNEYAIDYKKLASNILGDEVARSGEVG